MPFVSLDARTPLPTLRCALVALPLGGGGSSSFAGSIKPLPAFMTDPAGSAIVNAIGPIRRIVRPEKNRSQRYLVLLKGTPAEPGAPVQFQVQ